MKNKKFLFIAVFVMVHTIPGAGQAGLEQYYYLQKKNPVMLVPIVHVQSRNNWYAEARYNYEEMNTFSLYGGKSFMIEHNGLSGSLIPVAGLVVGNFDGASLGFNSIVEYRKFFFASQSQFTFSFSDHDPYFFFSWSELAFAPVPWLYFGGSVQHTLYKQSDKNLLEPGIVLGFIFGRFSLPLYSFNLPDNDRYFVLGINYGIE